VFEHIDGFRLMPDAEYLCYVRPIWLVLMPKLMGRSGATICYLRRETTRSLIVSAADDPRIVPL
jgi:hypothetical protein